MLPLLISKDPNIPPSDLTVNLISLAWMLFFGISMVTSCVGMFFVVLVFDPTSKSAQPYQPGRASITGLRLNVENDMKTRRLIGVACLGFQEKAVNRELKFASTDFP